MRADLDEAVDRVSGAAGQRAATKAHWEDILRGLSQRYYLGNPLVLGFISGVDPRPRRMSLPLTEEEELLADWVSLGCDLRHAMDSVQATSPDDDE